MGRAAADVPGLDSDRLSAVSSLEILVTVGSDHHPFDRLIGWVDEWLTEHRSDDVSCVLQHGTAVAPQRGTARDYLPHSELQSLLRAAQVVVTQGGPMGIVESLQCGTTPIAVPRLARLGEVVDDHQVAFCRQLSRIGKCVIAEDSTALWDALDLALDQSDVFTIEPASVDAQVARSVQKFGDVVDDLPPRRGLLRRKRK